jgi:hypothetical protein
MTDKCHKLTNDEMRTFVKSKTVTLVTIFDRAALFVLIVMEDLDCTWRFCS